MVGGENGAACRLLLLDCLTESRTLRWKVVGGQGDFFVPRSDVGKVKTNTVKDLLQGQPTLILLIGSQLPVTWPIEHASEASPVEPTTQSG